MDFAPTVQKILSRQRTGAFAAKDGGDPRPDATAWAVLGLRATGDAASEPTIESARDYLKGLQLADGRVPITPFHPAACWPTTLALLAWHGWPAGKETAQKALNFLDQEPVATFKDSPKVNTIDSTLRGWSWIGGTSCWVEPTAMAVFTLQHYGRSTARIQDGVRLLLDRQLPSGGWNFGNTYVFGTELLASEEYVGVALAGLAGNCEAKQVSQSIAFLEQRLPKLRTPLALGWGILGLSAWGRRPVGAADWIAECLSRQDKLGPFDTTHLALLIVANRCETGLAELFPIPAA